MNILLIKNVFLSSELKNKKDILIVNNEIAKIARNIDLKPLESLFKDSIITINAEGATAIPGFIDGHSHLLGASGEAGYGTRAPEITLHSLVSSGITTVVGLLGYDSLTRSLKSLYAKIKAFENEGLTARMLTGSYHLPLITITKNLKNDIYFFPEIIGAGEIAVSDQRSSYPEVLELRRIIGDIVFSAKAKGQKGVVIFHTGRGEDGLEIIEKLVTETDVPAENLILTHVNRSLNVMSQAKKLADLGCFVDISALYFQKKNLFPSPEEAIKELRKISIPLNKILISTDSGCYIENNVLTQPVWLYKAFRNSVKEKILTLQEAVKVFSANPARALGFNSKGEIKEGKDADILLIDRDLNLFTVIAKGKTVMLNKKLIINDYANGQKYETI